MGSVVGGDSVRRFIIQHRVGNGIYGTITATCLTLEKAGDNTYIHG